MSFEKYKLNKVSNFLYKDYEVQISLSIKKNKSFEKRL